MKSEKLYEDWKKQRSQAEVGHDFNEKVMKQVYEHRKSNRFLDIERLVEAIYASPFAKAGMVAAGVAAGFIRMAFTVYMFLGT